MGSDRCLNPLVAPLSSPAGDRGESRQVGNGSAHIDSLKRANNLSLEREAVDSGVYRTLEKQADPYPPG